MSFNAFEIDRKWSNKFHVIFLMKCIEDTITTQLHCLIIIKC